MHTRASNFGLAEPLPKPKCTLNRRLHRRNRRVPFDQRNNLLRHLRIVYLPILNINYFCNFLDILRNYDPIDDEPMWAANHVVAPTPGFAITIPKTANEFAIKGNHLTLVKEKFMDLKTQLETVAKNHQASIQNLETEFDRLADKQSGRPFGSLPSNTQPNPKGHNSKAYQPSQARNEHVNAMFTRSDDEPTPQPKTQNPKPSKETLLPKPYKAKIPHPQHLRKEKMEAQYGKFLDMIRAIRINVSFVDVLARMPNYGKFLKELISNKHKIKQISATFLSDESSAMIQNKVPPKLRDPESFLIPCNFNKTFSCNALADLGASINLMPYSLYAELSLETLKPTKISVRLADRSFQYPVRIAENMLVEVVIRVKQKQLNLGVGTKRMIFNIDSAMKHSYSNDDTYFSIDVIDEILEEDFDALLNKGSEILHSIEGTLLEEEIFAEFDEFMAMSANENSDSKSDTEEQPFMKITINTNYKIKTSLEEPLTNLELKPLPDNLEYVFLEEPSFLHVIISSQLLKEKKNKLVSVLDLGFYWTTIIKEAHTLVLLCEACQKTCNISKQDEMPLNNIQVDEIFDIWSIDFMGPFLKSYKFEHILIAVDYVSKWADAQALPTNDAPVVVTFLKRLFCRFGMPKALISDRGTHFCNKIMERTMKRYGINHYFSTSYHSQTSGQVENTNRALKRILEKTVKDNPIIWSRKLDDALWAFRTAYKTPTVISLRAIDMYGYCKNHKKRAKTGQKRTRERKEYTRAENLSSKSSKVNLGQLM
nr:reverse transcriptase domain-containing protein [Tanacetum cinerariifolium]